MDIPSESDVQRQIAAFDAELAQAKSARDAQTVRDRFLGRKNSVVAAWMQAIGAAPPEQKKAIGRFANELKTAIEMRWTAFQERAQATARPAGAIDVTLPGRVPAFGRRHPL